MSIQTDNTVNNQQLGEVDYADPESPTLAIRRLASPTTGPNERLTDVVETNQPTRLTQYCLAWCYHTGHNRRRGTYYIPYVCNLETRQRDSKRR